MSSATCPRDPFPLAVSFLLSHKYTCSVSEPLHTQFSGLQHCLLHLGLLQSGQAHSFHPAHFSCPERQGPSHRGPLMQSCVPVLSYTSLGFHLSPILLGSPVLRQLLLMPQNLAKPNPLPRLPSSPEDPVTARTTGPVSRRWVRGHPCPPITRPAAALCKLWAFAFFHFKPPDCPHSNGQLTGRTVMDSL